MNRKCCDTPKGDGPHLAGCPHDPANQGARTADNTPMRDEPDVYDDDLRDLPPPAQVLRQAMRVNNELINSEATKKFYAGQAADDTPDFTDEGFDIFSGDSDVDGYITMRLQQQRLERRLEIELPLTETDCVPND